MTAMTVHTSVLSSHSFVRPHNKIGLLLDLVNKLNSAFLRAQDLDEILRAVLVGVTAGEGLGFNRAFLVCLDKKTNVLKGKIALGPSSQEEAGKIWGELAQSPLSLFEIVDNVRESLNDPFTPINQLVKKINVPLSKRDHILVKSVLERRAFSTQAVFPSEAFSCENYDDIAKILGTDCFAVAPIATEDTLYGVVIADNFVTKAPITPDDLDALQLFASLAAMASCKVHMCGVLKDKVKTLETINRQLESHKEHLVKAERFEAIGRMAEQLSHEIRNPLSALGGMARILDRKVQDPGLKQYVDTIVRQAQRVEQTLGSFFDFSNIPEINPEPLNLFKLIEASIALMRSEMTRLNISWHTHLQGEEPIIHADRMHLQQAILNLIKNSVEAMPEGGLLLVSVLRMEDTVQIQITDTGLGMARGHLEKATEPFFTTKTCGLGLGLSLAKQVVELHGGRISLERNRFGGTTAIINLPFVMEEGNRDAGKNKS